MKMLKRYFLIFCFGFVALFGACSSGEQKKYSIDLETTLYGKVLVDKDRANYLDEVSLEIVPNAGYKLQNIFINDKKYDSDTSTTFIFSMPNEDVTVKANFVAINYMINIQSSSNGSVSLINNSNYLAKYYDFVTLQISPDDGYHLEGLYIDGEKVNVTGNSYVFNMPNKNINIFAVFEENV